VSGSSIGAYTTARTGVVATFDEEAGIGIVETGRGEELGFHCTQIADGTRTVPAGTPVRFTLIAGRGGSWEAGGVEPRAGSIEPAAGPRS
jgi:cold shock CspA family protein